MTPIHFDIYRARRLLGAGLTAFLIGWGSMGVAFAQDYGAAFSGFSSRSTAPIQIDADRLEIDDENKLATYSGNVVVQQGETVLKTVKLIIHYSGSSTNAAPGSAVTKLVADGRVIVIGKGQRATGNRATLIMETEIITLSGDVVLSDSKNVLKGDRLIVNMKSKTAQLLGDRVQTILQPGSQK